VGDARRWLCLLLVCGTYFLAFFQRTMIVPFFPEMLGEFGIGYAKVGGLLSAFFIGYALFQLPSGLLADRYDSSPLLRAGLVLLGGAGAVFLVTANYAVAWGARFAGGVASAMMYAPGTRLVAASFPASERGLAISLLEIAGGLATVASLSVLPALALRTARTAPMAVTTALALPVLAFAFWLRPSTGVSRSSAPGLADYRRLAQKGWRELVLLVGLAFTGLLPVNVVLGWLPTFFTEAAGFTKAGAAAAMAALMIAYVVVAPFAGKLSDLYGRRGILLVSCVVQMLAFAGLFLVKAVGPQAFAVAIVVGIGNALAVTPMNTLAAELFGVTHSAVMVSLMTTSAQAGSAIGNYACGVLLDYGGGFASIWTMLIAVLAVRLVITRGIRETRAVPVPASGRMPQRLREGEP